MSFKSYSELPNFESYSNLPYLSKIIAYFVFRKNKVDYKSIKDKFERFDEKSIREALEETTSQKPPFIIFNEKRNIYQPSIHLKRILNFL